MRRAVTRLLLIILTVPLASCGTVGGLFKGDEKPRLEGERISVLELQESLVPGAASGDSIVLPEPWKNAFWPQSGGYPSHAMGNLEIGPAPLDIFWHASIGKGASKRIPLIAPPIAVDGTIYVIDSDSRLSAFDEHNGSLLWKTNIRDPEEDDAVIAGGLAFSNGVVFVTNGYDEVLAVHPQDGSIIWRSSISAPSRAAPTILEGRVFVTTLDNRLLALHPANGQILWEYTGLSEAAGLIGAASPAANKDIVVPVFSSGEITALRIENGSVAWSDNLSNVRGGVGLASLSDIRAMPVIDENIVIAISFAGRLVAIDQSTGTRLWQHEIGGTQMPWVAGDTVFVLSSENQLVALSKDKGEIVWVEALQKQDQNKPLIWNGPVMAGGTLILAGSNGRLLFVNPQNGKEIGQREIGKPIVSAPVVAKGSLYIITENGVLFSLRSQKSLDFSAKQ